MLLNSAYIYFTFHLISIENFQRLIDDYLTFGIDYMGDDNMSSEDFVEYQINEVGEERYWDEPDGKED